MNKELIIEFIKRSGLNMLLEVGGMDKCLEHFAKLVAEHEREQCAKVCESHWEKEGSANWCARAIRARGNT